MSDLQNDFNIIKRTTWNPDEEAFPRAEATPPSLGTFNGHSLNSFPPHRNIFPSSKNPLPASELEEDEDDASSVGTNEDSSETWQEVLIPQNAPLNNAKLLSEESVDFSTPQNQALCRTAIANINEGRIPLDRLTKEEHSALLNDLQFIIELTLSTPELKRPVFKEFSNQAYYRLPEALEMTHSNDLLSQAIAKNLSKETKLHLLYAIKRINQLSKASLKEE